MLKYSDIKDWDESTIGSKVTELRRNLFELKMQAGTTGWEKSHRKKVIKSDVAKLLTALNAKRK